MNKPQISFITHGRNDGYMGDFLWRLSTCLNKIADNFSQIGMLEHIEILVCDWGSQTDNLFNNLQLNDSAQKVTQYFNVSFELAQKYNKDGEYSYPHAANVGIRRAKGDYIFCMDSDAYMPQETAKFLIDLINDKSVDFDNSFFWLSRKHIPYDFVEGSPTVIQIDDFISNKNERLITTAKCDLNDFKGGAVALFASSKIFSNIRGYNESLIYWGWCDIDIHYRLKIKYKAFDLWDFGAKMYHLEHYPIRGNVVNNRKMNLMEIPKTSIVNGSNWGVFGDEIPEVKFIDKKKVEIQIERNETPKILNIVISGTNYWNPGDDFVREGVIRILHNLFPDSILNFLFYNFNQDFLPQSKFSGIHNMVSKGDLKLCSSFIDYIVIAGLSAGIEIKDLYDWIIENRLEKKVLMLGAGYENNYVDKHIYEEPELKVFKNTQIIIGRTAKVPKIVELLNLPYYHLNCPAILAVKNVKRIEHNKNIENIAFSIQLPHGIGVPNHSVSKQMYQLSIEILIELYTKKYNLSVIAHHKSEYFHFLDLFKKHDLSIPVLFSSFYEDLYSFYPSYDLVITTRLHSSLFANGFGIPGIIVNDTDRHTHTLQGFPHSVWVNSKDNFDTEFQNVLSKNLSTIACEADIFKKRLLEKYIEVLSNVISSEDLSSSNKEMPIHFFTIVLNGKPFIEHHINVFKQLPFKWHWHIIEGVANLVHDTSWSLENGGKIISSIHNNGLSNDGTNEYIDELKNKYEANITVYRKNDGKFWDGKIEMVNAPLENINEECLLWQLDVDEYWAPEQIIRMRELFINNPRKTAAYYYCRYFVGNDLVITTRNTYGNHSEYEWLRTWRFKPGLKWTAHEPPTLSLKTQNNEWINIAKLNPFLHGETEKEGIVFDHLAYVLPKQIRFKETYYGYKGAFMQWEKLQSVKEFPVFLKNYFEWVNDDSIVDKICNETNNDVCINLTEYSIFELLERNPLDADLLNDLAVISASKHLINLSIKLLEASLKIYPNNKIMLDNINNIKSMSNSNEDDYLEKCIETFAKKVNYHIRLIVENYSN